MTSQTLKACWLSIILCLSFSGCEKRDIEAEKRAAVSEAFSKLNACIPGAEPETDLKLAITAVTIKSNETSIRLVAYAIDKPAEFDLPLYWLSSGRWLINQKERAYLLDENCREFKLKDRKSSSGESLPQGGKIRLSPGQAYEATLSFSPMPENTRMGVLIYGARAIPFFTSAEKK